MEYHVYRLLKIFCFEIFKDEKYGLLLGLFELSMIFKVFGNMIFRIVMDIGIPLESVAVILVSPG